jgi:hypothetical protein
MEYGRQLQIAVINRQTAESSLRSSSAFRIFFIGFIQERTFLDRAQWLWIQITNMTYELGWDGNEACVDYCKVLCYEQILDN